jgi:hypothetical protein
MECHGPFEKLIADTANYVMRTGEIMSPHRYEPHNSKTLPDCKDCHKPHPIPLISTEGLPTPSAQYCYTCHHHDVLECHTCHE